MRKFWTKKKIAVLIVIVGILSALHIVINNFDLIGFIRAAHGG